MGDFGAAQERASQKEEAIGIAKTPKSGGYKEAARIKGIRIGNRMVAEKELRDFDNALNMAQKEYIGHASHYSEVQNAAAQTRMNQNYNKIRDGIIRQGIEIDKKMAEEKLDADQKNFLIKQVRQLGGQLAFGYYMKESKQMFDDFMSAKESQMVAKGAELGVPQEGPGGQTYQEYSKRTGQAPEPKSQFADGDFPHFVDAGPTMGYGGGYTGEGETHKPGYTQGIAATRRGEFIGRGSSPYSVTPPQYGDKAIQPTSLNDPIMDKIVTDPMERRLIEAGEMGGLGYRAIQKETGDLPEEMAKELKKKGISFEETIIDPHLAYPDRGEFEQGPTLDSPTWGSEAERLRNYLGVGRGNWTPPGLNYPPPGR